MARRTFFSFDYKYAWKVNQIRRMRNVISTSSVGFEDTSLWEEARKKGDQEVHRMIDEALQGTEVTVVCVTKGTTDRKYLDYEIDHSLARGNGLVAVQIHHHFDPSGDEFVLQRLPFVYLPANLAASSIQRAKASSLIYLYALNQFD